jgi:SAM-dependent methyltransferase
MTTVGVFHRIISDTLKRPPQQVRVLDFGCGSGELVRELLGQGYDAFGCDIGSDWPADRGEWQRGLPATKWATEFRDRLSPIQSKPYRLPYDDATFDAVISLSVLEHVQNKEEAFAEFARVIKPDGIGAHMFPSKWNFRECHLFVPMVSILWPNIPAWWLDFWALLGIRNQFQAGIGWREVAKLNKAYCRDGIHYWSRKRIHVAFDRVFGGHLNYDLPRAAASDRKLVHWVAESGIGAILFRVRDALGNVCTGHPNLLAHKYDARSGFAGARSVETGGQ